MPVICPAILAKDAAEYRRQMEKVAGFAQRIQIDLTDGDLAQDETIKAEDAWWPVGVKADFHLMYRDPHHVTDTILRHRPHMIIIHAESSGNFIAFSQKLRQTGVKVGIALLPQTSITVIMPALDKIDHVLIFSGKLGQFGGHANLDLLNKVRELKRHRPQLEVGWDGGVNERNISQIVFAGVDVFDVGGFIQNADDPHRAYRVLARIADETGTT
jgi:ribulose-phosphate 3-epimerase